MESSRRVIIMLIAGVVVIFGVIAIRSFMGGEPEPAAPEELPPRMVVATRDITQGSVIDTARDLEWKDVAKEEIKPEYLLEGKFQVNNLNGAIVRRQIRTGDPVTWEALTQAGAGGFMSAVLEPGMRAVSVAVSPTSGNAGFISPGDRVDLIVTHRVRNPNSPQDGAVVSETFVHNVRVIAVDQMLDNPDNKAILAKTVTVEVTPQQAEQIAVATDLGKISLVLRSLANGQPVVAEKAAEEEGVSEDAVETVEMLDSAPMTDLYGNVTPKPQKREYTRDSDVSRALDAGGVSSTIRVIRGDQVENVSLQ